MTNPTWAGRSAHTPRPEDNDERAGWIPVAGVIAALGLVGVGGFILGSAGSAGVDASTVPTTSIAPEDSTTSSTESPSANESSTDTSTTSTTPTTEQAEPAEQVDTTEAASDQAADTDDAASDETEPEETEIGSDPSDSEAAAQVVIQDGEVRGAVLRGGVLFLGGAVPSREVADQIIERAAAVVGEDNIVDEYVIDPDAELVPGAPLYVDDVVLFAYGERTYDPQFEPILDLGLALLLQNPSVNVTIVTHTDASGSASYNHRLSYQRGESVAQYWVDRGVPVEQIRIDARGEHDPRASNDTDEGAQLNRRAEFYIEGLLS